jgi:hypothetical protein
VAIWVDHDPGKLPSRVDHVSGNCQSVFPFPRVSEIALRLKGLGNA